MPIELAFHGSSMSVREHKDLDKGERKFDLFLLGKSNVRKLSIVLFVLLSVLEEKSKVSS
jgi:hypothetical protein